MSLLSKRGLYRRCLGSTVTLGTNTSTRGIGGMLPRKKNDKNGAIWCNLGFPKYVIINLKITILRVINHQQQNLIAISPLR